MAASCLLILSQTQLSFFFFFNIPAPPEISPLPLPAALPFCHDRPGRREPTAPLRRRGASGPRARPAGASCRCRGRPPAPPCRRARRGRRSTPRRASRSEEHTSELQSRLHLVCRLLLEKKKNN